MTSETPPPPDDPDQEETFVSAPQDPDATILFTPTGEAGAGDTEGMPHGDAKNVPKQIGRYALEKVLGAGGFGAVYLADDLELQRPVAIKIPHEQSLVALTDLEAFLDEARILASLDHAHIVPVYDIGRTDDGTCYIVSKFIDGSSLRTRIGKELPSPAETALTVASIADALNYAHERGIVHRDIKPDNILLDHDGTPFLSDFGLALKNEQLGTGPGFVGTASYMSPEQARGEGHLVDGRSDQFSLGVVLYVLLTGKRPFAAKTIPEIMKRIRDDEPTRPREENREIPRELERICLKAMEKRILDRYENAGEMADELRAFAERASTSDLTGAGFSDATREFSHSYSIDSPSMIGPVSPRGLQAFEESDADFFLRLLPGALDRKGLPPVVRFWKGRVEETSPERLLRVGLLYGPSGCGKSSIVRAGILPQLSPDVQPILIVATPNETEASLARQIQQQFPKVERGGDLADTILAVRRADPERRLLIVIDQFEQWLQAHTENDDAEFVRAMRQCDGVRVQTLLLVRDEFWMSVIGFLRQLDITLEEGKNSKAVDLFEFPHARKVLTAFGRAYETLPPAPEPLEPAQKQFIEAAIKEIGEDGRVVPVRLALFAEMMRRREWTPDSLQKLGGAEGVGVAFLDECFRSSHSPPEYRLHREAAREILGALLPEAGQRIRGHRRSLDALAEASGYQRDSNDFQKVLHILCEDLRLLSAVDPLGAESQSAEPHYELTHDYLVPSLHTWLERERRETRQGRTRILLERRSDFWNARPEHKQLPGMLETFRIRLFTKPDQWSSPQKKMMRVATRVQGLRAAVVLAVLIGISFAAIGTAEHLASQQEERDTDARIGRLIVAEPNRIQQELAAEIPNPEFWETKLREISDDSSRPLSERVRAQLALVEIEESVAEKLAESLHQVSAGEHSVIVETLSQLRSPPTATLEEKLKEAATLDETLKLAAALAQFDDESSAWSSIEKPVVEALLEVGTGQIEYWTRMLEPVRDRLKPHLQRRFDDERTSPAERQFSSTILALLLRRDAESLVRLAVRGDGTQMRELVNSLREHREAGLGVLRSIEEPLLARDLDEASLRTLLGTTIVRFQLEDAEALWDRLVMVKDPSLRTELIFQLQQFGIPMAALVKRLREESRPSCRQALLLALGEFSPDSFEDDERAKIVREIQAIATSPQTMGGTHIVALSLLAAWETDTPELKAVPATETAGRQWWRDSQGFTMMLMPAARSFRMGSPYDEDGRTVHEDQHDVPLRHRIAVSSCEATVEQFRRFEPGHVVDGRVCPVDTCPVTAASWYDAIRYCRWLSEQEGLPEEEMVYPSLDDLKLFALHEEGATIPDELASLSEERLSRTGYRLPTSAEWEYICRAGSQTSFHFGTNLGHLTRFAWTAISDQAGRETHPVGQFQPNAWGLLDITGNVSEWTHDGPNPTSTSSDGVTVGEIYIRGGHYRSASRHVRSALLWTSPAQSRYSFNGFRVVRTIRDVADRKE